MSDGIDAWTDLNEQEGTEADSDAAEQYNLLRLKRMAIRLERNLTPQEEAGYGAEMDIHWQKMTPEEQAYVG